MLENYNSVGEAFLRIAELEDRGVVFIRPDLPDVFVSYRELKENALHILGKLQSYGVKKGDELVIQLTDDQKFVYVFWACILGGIIVVPIPGDIKDENITRLLNVWPMLRNPYLVTYDGVMERLEEFESPFIKEDGIRESILTIDMDEEMEAFGVIQETNRDDLALIQFSSGSTGSPKGIMITHNNILHNIIGYIPHTNITERDVSLCWLPLYHNFGLVAAHIGACLLGAKQCILFTQLFTSQPSIWLEKMSQYRVTRTFTPNYGYKYVINDYDPEKAKDWDLSNLTYILNGAEPVSKTVCDDFYETLKGHGLKKEAMYYGYGMTEATLFISVPTPGDKSVFHYVDRNLIRTGSPVVDADPEGHSSVSFAEVGYGIMSCAVRITDDSDKVLPENHFGNVEIKGESVMKGYFNNEEETRNAFTEDHWFRTGDTGFIRNGRVTLTGRKKEMIIINGVNYYPSDLERLIEEIRDLQGYKVVACGIKKEVEEIYIFVEYSGSLEDFTDLASKIKVHLAKKLGAEVSGILPIETIQKTASGKVQRFKLNEMYLKGEFKNIENELEQIRSLARIKTEREQPRNRVEKDLVHIFTSVLDIDEIGVLDNIAEYGIDSMMVTKLLNNITAIYPGKANIATLYSCFSIREIADKIIREDFEIYAIPMMKEIFKTVSGIDSGELSTIELKLGSELANALRITADENKIEIKVILHALFFMLIKEYSEEHSFCIPSITNAELKNIKVDFEKMNSYMDLFMTLKRQYDNEEKVILEKQLSEWDISKKEYEIIPVFHFSKGNMKANPFFDLILNIRLYDSTFNIVFHYNQRTLRSDRIREIAERYLQMVDELMRN